MKLLESLKSLRTSKTFAAFNAWHANNMGYRKKGLRLDDLIPDEGPVVREALRRLPPHEFQERNFRFKRAIYLSLTKAELPKEEWTTAETDIAYLRPYVDLVQAEIQTKENFDTMASIPAALLQRNRSS
ncbi:Cytochrome b-c1 complex subunit 7, mitochondrial [Polyrhizophydium stewartii]|uniref:Complex III subunit 7 n=1 Tax=Polyrhizophydium stewartii TaxID=2732419 RepID=A0ABR4N4D0_9FUNG|nr:Cytochrome b-c1 complex subunit 7 [Polyrhizophydium stewartii]